MSRLAIRVFPCRTLLALVGVTCPSVVLAANVGYYDINAGAGAASQVTPITTAGGTAVNVANPNAATLASLDVLFAWNPSNSAYGTEYTSNAAAITSAVYTDGMILVIHDRYVTTAASILPGGGGITATRSPGRAIDVRVSTTLVTNGPGGVVTSTTLDDFGYSTHGYLAQATMPAGSVGILSTGTSSEWVTSCYPYGAGAVVYSGIPLDVFVTSAGMATYAANVVAYAMDGACATPIDADGDGSFDGADCDDADASVHPGAAETCDGEDDDCDGTVDEADAADAADWYADTDGDSYGNAGVSVTACDAPAAYVADASDCDDGDATVHPGADEVCDSEDNDCDGTIDEDAAVDALPWYADADEDAFGDPSVTHLACQEPAGYVADGTDCDDADASRNPGVSDTPGDGIDSDCDGGEACYTDADDDGYRPDGTSTVASADEDCSDGGEALAIEPIADCDDGNAAIHPAAVERPGDTVDQDCDGAESCYVDADADGARTDFLVASPDVACTALGEALATADIDCDDTDPSAYPAATELTGTGVDEDCDGAERCYADADDDDYRPDATATVPSADGDCDDAGEALATALLGDCDDTSVAYNPAAVEADCADPNDYNCDGSVTFRNTDGDAFAACEECDDGDATVYPGAVEDVGDGVDSDCDGVDQCFADGDDDGYRPGGTSPFVGTTVACDGPGEASNLDGTGDCDDADATVNPAALELPGDALDSNCDSAETCYVDADADGYRTEDGATVESFDASCDAAGEAYASAGPDCDDTEASTHPSAAERAGDEVDSDCDGAEWCYADADADGYRPDETTTVASADVGCVDAGEALASAPTTDCDDTDATVNPDSLERVGDSVDSDCDGTELCYADADDDGYRGDDAATVDSPDADCDDVAEALATDLTGDCNDTSTAYHPGATEADCTDPNDYDCDGSVGYADADADGFAACEECDDGDATVFPGAIEAAGDGVDQDCDGAETCYLDLDDDGYRPDTTSTVASTNIACNAAGEAVGTDGSDDCDDADATINPSATELAGDEVDQDCDSTEYCLVDGDGDGYRADGGAVVASADTLCDGTGEALGGAPSGDCDDADTAFHPGAAEDDCADPTDYNCDGASGYADADADGFAACEECDDASSAVHPEADEVCNGADDDCDGTIDQDATDATTWYADADGDGFTDPSAPTEACDAPDGYAAPTDEDCDDADATRFPGGDDLPDDGVDQDCDGEDAVGADPDTGVIEDTGGVEDTGGDCGCASTSASTGGGAALPLALGLLLAARRRRRA
jgi:MYXO-CTERM domain-containing protein